jgi:hypothetical protein
MQSVVHPKSGERVQGIRLSPGMMIAKGDLYDSTDGKWRENENIAGLTIQPGCSTIWVRQPQSLSENAKTLLGYLDLKVWGPKTCLAKRNQNFYVIPSPDFNWDGRISIEAIRVKHPECVKELVDHGLLILTSHHVANWNSDYSSVSIGSFNQIYLRIT